MTRPDPFETELLEAYDAGKLKPVASKAELARLKEAARATATKDRWVNIRLSAGDLQDIQVKALAEGMPYQTLIASILHKYVTGRLQEIRADGSNAAPKAKDPARRRRDVFPAGGANNRPDRSGSPRRAGAKGLRPHCAGGAGCWQSSLVSELRQVVSAADFSVDRLGGGRAKDSGCVG